MKKSIVANWKMNPATWREAERLAVAAGRAAKEAPGVEVVICPPFPFLSLVACRMSHVKLGAQDIFWEKQGAYTGEVSPQMLKNLGVEYVIIGHSERRKWFNETDEMVNKKVLAALRARLKVLLCVGEPAERGLTRNYKNARNYVRKQLEKDLQGLRGSASVLRSSALVIAYEPVWAIGAGRADKPSEAAEMIKFIKDVVSSMLHTPCSMLRVLYGGSVTGKNAGSFLQYKEIDGALVGGASLKAEEFKKIIAQGAN